MLHIKLYCNTIIIVQSLYNDFIQKYQNYLRFMNKVIIEYLKATANVYQFRTNMKNLSRLFKKYIYIICILLKDGKKKWYNLVYNYLIIMVIKSSVFLRAMKIIQIIIF